MLPSVLFVQLILSYWLLAYSHSSLQPGFIPLAVKTPYLQGWVTSGGGQTPGGIWPNFVSNNRILGWAGIIRVDNATYQWMGDSEHNFTTTVLSEITPSKSIFRIEAGAVQFNVTFLSPIEPNDYVRQSMPFSYMYIDGIAANDSRPHTVQVYSDISAEWVSREDTAQVIWNTTDINGIMYHHVTRRSPSPMVESGGISEDSTAYFATVKRTGLSWREGNDVNSRRIFATNGTLTNTFDTNYRPVSPNWPVFAFSVDLGTISPGNQLDPVVWAIGVVRDPLVTYTTNGHTQNRSAYYWANYMSIDEVISAFLSDFPGALTRSSTLDNRILFPAFETSTEYAGILSLVTRQIFASMDITIPSVRQHRQFNYSDVKIFMKDIGQSQRTNAVEVIYGALPALLFLNPSLARDLLQPLLESQSSPQYPNSYAAPDLGASYPLVHGDSTDTYTLGIETCGNMLIMVYAYAAKSGDGALLFRYHSLLQRWADFLVENSLHPRGFTTADGLNNPDMSNLALKGIIGIYSMAKVNEAVGVSNTTYMDQAMRLIKDWKQFAIGGGDHIQAVYGQTASWGLMYNLFPAVWLQTGLIEDSILESQAQFYAQQNSSNFGLSLDTSQFDATYPHWNLMTAATIPDNMTTIRNGLINSTFQRAYKPNSTSPLPVAYRPSDGGALFGTGSGSPILGAAFAVAAMQLQNLDIQNPGATVLQNKSPLGSPSASPSASSSASPSASPSVYPSVSPSALPSSSHTKDNVGATVGGVLGSLAFLLVATATYIFWRKHKQPPQYKFSPFMAPGESSFSRLLPPPATGRPSNSNPPPAGTVAPLLSRKQREALGRSRWHAFSRQSELPLLASSDSNRGPLPETDDLRAELEQLRQEMESIRRRGDAPPEYS